MGIINKTNYEKVKKYIKNIRIKFLLAYFVLFIGGFSCKEVLMNGKFYVNENNQKVFDYLTLKEIPIIDVYIFLFIFLIGLRLMIRDLSECKEIRDNLKEEISKEDVLFEKISVDEYVEKLHKKQMFYKHLIVYVFVILAVFL